MDSTRKREKTSLSKSNILSFVFLVLLLFTSFHVKQASSSVGSDFVLVDHLSFDEGIGLDAFDSSGYGNDGTLMNGANWVIPGRFGNAVRTDGINDYINVSDRPSLDITGKIRIEAWINPDMNDQLMNIVSKWAPGNYSYALNIGVLQDLSYPPNRNPGTHPGKIGFLWASDGTSATRQFLVSSSIVSAGLWTNVTVVYDGSLVKLFLNGNLDNSTAYSGSFFAGDAELRIGASAEAEPFFFDGLIDEVRIHRTFPTYDATIMAYCNIERSGVSVSIKKDDASTGFMTPHTFTEFGTHRFTVPNVDANGHTFSKWNTGATSTTIIVSTSGTYTAYYGTQIIGPNPYDLDGSGMVDAGDLRIFSLAFGSRVGEPNWSPECDFNNDNRIDALDLIQLSKNYGTT